MKKLIIILTFLIGGLTYAQNINFITSYGNSGYDIAKDIQQAADTGYICTGGSSSFGPDNEEAFLLKVDSLGNFEWSYNYGGQGTEWGEAVVNTLDSAYALAGYTNSFGNGGFDFYLVKTDIQGVPVFEKTYGGTDWDRAFGMREMPDSGFVLVGDTYSFGSGNLDIYIVRTDKNGDTLWTRSWGGAEDDFANDVLIDGDSIVVVGGTNSFGSGMSDGIILKYHIDGTFGWAHVAGKERNDYFTGIIQNQLDDEYFLSGSRHYYFDQLGDLPDFWIYNITEDGATVLADTSLAGGSHEVEVAYDIEVDAGENIFYGGETKSFGHALTDGNYDAWLGKFQNNYFQANYVQNFGQFGNDAVYAIDMCYDNGIVGCGKIEWMSTGGYNMFIVRVDQFNTQGAITVTTEMTYDSLTLNFKELVEANEFAIYPTLVENEIHFEGFPENSQFEIMTMNGQMVRQKNLVKSTVLLDGLESGFYILLIHTEDNIYTQKIFKY